MHSCVVRLPLKRPGNIVIGLVVVCLLNKMKGLSWLCNTICNTDKIIFCEINTMSVVSIVHST